MKTLTEKQMKLLFLSLLIESLDEALGIKFLTEEEEAKLFERIDEANEGSSELEVLSQILDTMIQLLDELDIRDQTKGDLLQ